MNEADFKELKKGGMMRQVEAGRFSVRLHVVGGELSAGQLAAVVTAAERFGRGRVHLTARQGIEIPHVAAESLAEIKELLSAAGVGIGVCGPTVRTVTACQGCTLCPSGVIDAPAYAQAVDQAFYGASAPHKFKVGITGCINNCLKAEENDVGLKGWIEPATAADAACTACGVCEAVCPSRAIRVPDAETGAVIDASACIGCGDCIVSCPTSHIVANARGFRVYVGGKFGRSPSLAEPVLGVQRSIDDAVRVVAAVLDFFRAHGKARERFADTLKRTGLTALETHLATAGGLS